MRFYVGLACSCWKSVAGREGAFDEGFVASWESILGGNLGMHELRCGRRCSQLLARACAETWKAIVLNHVICYSGVRVVLAAPHVMRSEIYPKGETDCTWSGATKCCQQRFAHERQRCYSLSSWWASTSVFMWEPVFSRVSTFATIKKKELWKAALPEYKSVMGRSTLKIWRGHCQSDIDRVIGNFELLG